MPKMLPKISPLTIMHLLFFEKNSKVFGIVLHFVNFSMENVLLTRCLKGSKPSKRNVWPALFCEAKYRKQLTWLLSFLIALFHWKCFLSGLILIIGGSRGWVKLPFNRVTHFRSLLYFNQTTILNTVQRPLFQRIPGRFLVWPLTFMRWHFKFCNIPRS